MVKYMFGSARNWSMIAGDAAERAGWMHAGIVTRSRRVLEGFVSNEGRNFSRIYYVLDAKDDADDIRTARPELAGKRKATTQGEKGGNRTKSFQSEGQSPF